MFVILGGAVFSSSVGATHIDEKGISTQKINKESATEPMAWGAVARNSAFSAGNLLEKQ
ncbi:MAG: hypothetical protein ACQEWU_10055 [Bacillota bacterium]